MNHSEIVCPICDSPNSVPKRRLYDDRYGYPGEFTLIFCLDCGHCYLDVLFSDKALSRLYSDYYPRSLLIESPYQPAPSVNRISAWWRGSMFKAFRWVPAGSKVLDIGCGDCQSLGYLRNLGCEVQGVEADENVRTIAEREGFDVHIGTFDPALYPENSFDYVIMDQVIEHVSNPYATLRGIQRILKPDGRAILSTPNASGWGAHLFGSRWVHWHAPFHLQYFSRRSMEIASQQVGLEIERVVCITGSAWLRFQWLHLMTLPGMGKPSPFWAPKSAQQPMPVMRRRLVTMIHLTGIDHLLTRMFDVLGIGDNQLFFLKKQFDHY